MLNRAQEVQFTRTQNSLLVLTSQRLGNDSIQGVNPLPLLLIVLTYKQKLSRWCDHGDPWFPLLHTDSLGQASSYFVALIHPSNKNLAQCKCILERRKQKTVISQQTVQLQQTLFCPLTWRWECVEGSLIY